MWMYAHDITHEALGLAYEIDDDDGLWLPC
jgi:hypothetical protein